MNLYTQLIREMFDTRKEIEANVKTFDVMINAVDVSIERWYLRLSLYGHPNFEYRNTEEKVSGPSTWRKFSDVMDQSHVLKTLGEWEVTKLSSHGNKENTVSFYREFFGLDGKKHEEEFIVWVDYRPDVKKVFDAF